MFILITLLCFFQNSSKEITLLPNTDKVYKIDYPLNMEEILLAFSIEENFSDIKHLNIQIYNDSQLLNTTRYDVESLKHFLRSSQADKLSFHNIQITFPKSLNANKLSIAFETKMRVITEEFPMIRYQQSLEFKLPVNGSWFISSGHDFGIEHRRHLSRGHFAWDFQKIDKSGNLSTGTALTDYYSYGQDVIAVADGVVVAIHDGEIDNIPGEIKSKKANYIEIDHGNNIVSRYVHLKQNSIRVKLGDSVKAKDLIAKVGNSGRSDSPHLHIGFQRNYKQEDNSYIYEPLPIQFNNYLVTWNLGIEKKVKQGRPRRGQFVRNQ